MTTKTTGLIIATRQKLLAQITLAQRQADSTKKAAKAAKVGFKSAKQKFKDVKRAAKTAKKMVKTLKTALAATVESKAPAKSAAAPKAASKRLRGAVSAKVVREPVVTVSPATASVPPVVVMG